VKSNTALLAMLSLCSFFSAPVLAVESFDKSIRMYEQPQLFDDNDKAFNARLYILDHAPKGASVKVATFVFDYGERVQQLAAHMCKASKRGVSVELLVDSKSGDRVDQEDTFDSTDDIKKAEQIYSYLATCGVSVYIHNSIQNYVTFFGYKLPNVFDVKNGSSVGLIKILNRISDIKSRLSKDILNPALKKMGISLDSGDVIDRIQSLAMSVSHLAGIKGLEEEGGGADPISAVKSRYKKLMLDPFWKQMDVSKMKVITDELQKAFLQDKGGANGVSIKEVYGAIRTFNRLNHRKMFLVETADGSSGCAFIGGRNLGDHYLKNSEHSFHDGDVLVCKHHLENAEDGGDSLFASINQSFAELRDNEQDPGNPDKKSPVRLVQPNAKYQKLLSDSVKDEGLSLGLPLVNFSNPRLLLTGWDPRKDEVRFALLRAISREQNEIYIETAYAEYNGSIRRALKKAIVERGVKVFMVTNGLFISDGPSKLIRFWMRDWMETMQRDYPKHFTAGFATLNSGHMIHFKGAGFRCQLRRVKKKGSEALVDVYERTYFIGSHNFHPRSGSSDKEHMLQWDEATDASCISNAPDTDLVALRKAYYANLNKTGKPQLMKFPTIYHECTTAISYANKFPKDKDLAKSAIYARTIKLTMYESMGTKNQPTLLYPEETKRFVELLDESGLRDLTGLFL
jgi:phosphatidylserine/phosphatidylglycerophosphate/cardiolipin synthase-like enzyme